VNPDLQFKRDIDRRVQLGEITRKEAFRLIREREDARIRAVALSTPAIGMASAGVNGMMMRDDEDRQMARAMNGPTAADP
jgi:hypothetical protein